jgi:hypothetical protein
MSKQLEYRASHRFICITSAVKSTDVRRVSGADEGISGVL